MIGTRNVVIVLLLLIVVSVPIASADTDVNTQVIAQSESGDIGVSQTFVTNDSINADIDAVTNGDLTLQTIFDDTDNAYVNVGVNMNPYYDYSTRINRGDGQGLTLKRLAYWLREGVDIITKGETQSGSKHARDYIAMILTDLARVFATKSELESMYGNQMDLHYRLVAVERTLNKIAPDEYCESKLEVMRDYRLPGTECGDWKYSISEGHNGAEIIGIRNVPQPEEPDPEPEVPEEPEPKPDLETLQKWDEMCESGMLKWCSIAEQYRQEYGIE